MRLYNAIAEGTLVDGENILLQLDLPTLGRKRARVISWSASFNGLIAGNVLSFRMTRDSTTGTATQSGRPVVLDGSHFDEVTTNEPITRWGFSTAPTISATIEGPLQTPDSAHVYRQYAGGREPLLDMGSSRTSLRCTPSDLEGPVQYKVNLIFRA